jgi:hypothetical protein
MFAPRLRVSLECDLKVLLSPMLSLYQEHQAAFVPSAVTNSPTTAVGNRDCGNFLSLWPECAKWHGGAILQPAELQ